MEIGAVTEFLVMNKADEELLMANAQSLMASLEQMIASVTKTRAALEAIRNMALAEYERGFNAPYKQIAELAQEALDA